MKTSRLLRAYSNNQSLYLWSSAARTPHVVRRTCSCRCDTGFLGLSETKPLKAAFEHHRGRTRKEDPRRIDNWDHPATLKEIKNKSNKKKKGKDNYQPGGPPGHRAIGTALSLFTTDTSSPGAPFFQPDGTHIFQKLVSFLRAQYPHYGLQEVLTPTMYKQALWEQSGHWENYKDDMFTVTGNVPKKLQSAAPEFSDGRLQPKAPPQKIPQATDEYGLKPMNCPGHCLLFQNERRSYRDLPIRYAEFSPLHRNEISGALSGLTRVRRFHQDDGHIFCRPIQVKQEIVASLAFIRLVYKTLGLKDYRFVLSTRPKKDYIGSVEEWDRAENQLRAALEEDSSSQRITSRTSKQTTAPEELSKPSNISIIDVEGTEGLQALLGDDSAAEQDTDEGEGEDLATERQMEEGEVSSLDPKTDKGEEAAPFRITRLGSGATSYGDQTWQTHRGEGAFYGPKIDVMVRDSDYKEHQTGTIQLDFQLPKRFGLVYESPAPNEEAAGEKWKTSRTPVGKVTPVMIHRAILGSLERFMALYLEHCNGQLPFWLNPKQIMVMTVTNNEPVIQYAAKVKKHLIQMYPGKEDDVPHILDSPPCKVDVDDSADSIAQKIVRAKKKKYSIILIVGAKNIPGKDQEHADTVDADISSLPDQRKIWTMVNTIQPGSQAPVQKDRGTGAKFRGLPGVRLHIKQMRTFIRKLNEGYC